jgi:hypothetical protein
MLASSPLKQTYTSNGEKMNTFITQYIDFELFLKFSGYPSNVGNIDDKKGYENFRFYCNVRKMV